MNEWVEAHFRAWFEGGSEQDDAELEQEASPGPAGDNEPDGEERQHSREQSGRAEEPDGYEEGTSGEGFPISGSAGGWLGRTAEGASYVMLFAIAAAMRLWDLGSRAMHHDESLHALYAWRLYEGQGYIHDPLMHGPFQFHGTALMYFLFGDNDYTARLLPALFGIALVIMPYFLRDRLGRIGALAAAGLLAFSPALLYFSRFARNDIYMAVWAFGLVIVMWKYLDTRKPVFAYLFAALLALAFATKETAYIVAVILGGFLLVLAAPELLRWATGRLDRGQVSAPGGLLVLMAALLLPLVAPGIALFDGFLGLTLANPDPGQGPVGLPSGLGAAIVAAGTVLVAALIAIALGHTWWRGIWWRSAAVFWGTWLLFYTTVFTNLGGVASGLWQSLGYWIVQQDVARGGQPWYYYFVIGSVYEFLPLLFSAIAAVYYLRKGDLFPRFLVFWAVLTFALYTAASEKMPWLLVNITLPFSLLAARFLGDVAADIPWRWLWACRGWAVFALVPALLILATRLAFYELATDDSASIAGLLFLMALVSAIFIVTYLLARDIGWTPLLKAASVGLAGILLLFVVRAGWVASYQNGDVPVEMLVYTQTSPALAQVATDLQGLRQQQADSLQVAVDATDGFAWPWAWYLRDADGVSYPCLSSDPGCAGLSDPPDADVLLLASRNEGDGTNEELNSYVRAQRYEHRWWFPEDYRGITPGKFLSGLVDRHTWRTALDYFLYREVEEPLGSSDAVLYYAEDLSPLAHTE